MTDEELVALAAIAGWGVDICPIHPPEGKLLGWSGLAWSEGNKRWISEASEDKQRVIDELRRRIFDEGR